MICSWLTLQQASGQLFCPGQSRLDYSGNISRVRLEYSGWYRPMLCLFITWPRTSPVISIYSMESIRQHCIVQLQNQSFRECQWAVWKPHYRCQPVSAVSQTHANQLVGFCANSSTCCDKLPGCLGITQKTLTEIRQCLDILYQLVIFVTNRHIW